MFGRLGCWVVEMLLLMVVESQVTVTKEGLQRATGTETEKEMRSKGSLPKH